MGGANANSYETRRNFTLIGFGPAMATGNTDGIEVNTNGALGWEGELAGFRLSAEAGIRYTYLEIDDFTESGAFPFGMRYNQQDGESLQSTLGLRLSREINVGNQTLIPELRAGWRHEFLDQDVTTTGRFTGGLGTPISTFTPGTGRDIADLGAGLTWLIRENVSLTLNYDAQLADDFVSHNVTGLIRYRW